jgi:hypothetical protein
MKPKKYVDQNDHLRIGCGPTEDFIPIASSDGYSKQQKAWIALFKDESEYQEYLKWRRGTSVKDDDKPREEIYQHLNTLPMPASAAHGLTLWLFKNYRIEKLTNIINKPL